MADHLVVFAVALGTVLVTTPIVRLAALRLGAVDVPGERRVHTRTTPTLGGLALFAGVLASFGVASILPAFDEVFRSTSEPRAIVLAAAVIVAVGVLDDVRGVSAPAKLAGQILAGGVLVLFGVRLVFAYVPGSLGIVSLSGDLGALLTVLMVVAMVNAVNLVDGLDGLAAGIVAIAAAALFAYSWLQDPQVTLGLPSAATLVLAAVVGVCLGFLVHNFHPASIFMGDTGAMLLGLLLAAGGVSAVGRAISPVRSDFAALSIPVLVPALVLAVPFLDTTWTILRRLASGRKVFSPDKQHLHHRLLEIGHSHRRAVLTMYYWSALLAFAAVGVGVLPLPLVGTVLATGAALGIVVAVVPRLVRGIARLVRRTGPATPDPGSALVYPFTKSSTPEAKTASDLRKRASRGV